MSHKIWFRAGAVAILSLSLASTMAWADHGNGHGNGHHDRDDDDDHHGNGHGHGHAYGHYKHDRYDDHDRDEMRGWYRAHYQHLPPGWRHDHLPPGWQRRLVVNSAVPPEYRVEMHPCPPELVQVLPPPPPNYAHFYLGGNIVLVNRANFQVADVFHLDVNIH